VCGWRDGSRGDFRKSLKSLTTKGTKVHEGRPFVAVTVLGRPSWNFVSFVVKDFSLRCDI